MTDIEFSDIQGNVLNGYRYDHAWYLMFAVESATAGRDCLAAIIPDVTTAHRWQRDDRPDSTVNVAITYSGFRQLGLPDQLLARFPHAFRQPTSARAAYLGDVGESAPDRWDDALGTGAVHILVTVHGSTDDEAGAARDRVVALLRDRGGHPVAQQHANALCNKREHFGYADGAGQPDVEGVPRLRREAPAAGGGVPLPGGGWRPVRLGEFVLGYADEDGTIVEVPHPDLVRNGTYVVYRKLQQDVARFRQALAHAAERSGLPEELVAAKVVGRWRDGMPLQLSPDRAPEGDLSEEMTENPPNDFRFLPDDRRGDVCPRGAHIRRANPRDSLDFGGAVKAGGALTARHRIIRRGIPYGTEYDTAPGDPKRGLIFVCYNADIERQFEIVQSQWCNDGDAFGLGDDRDFLLAGPGSGKMTIPVRGSVPRFVPVPSDLVLTRGAEYLFAPGCRALARLADGAFSA
jgi:Dyp-type peroxidase family